MGEADGTTEEGDEGSGSFRDLIDAGLIARENEGGFNPFSDADPVSAFVGALNRQAAPTVVGLGSNPRFWEPRFSAWSTFQADVATPSWHHAE